MASYKLTESARADISGIVNYTLREWGQRQALAYIQGLEDVAQTLAERPLIGKDCNDLHSGLRGYPYRSHTLYYLQAVHGITIVRVLHQKMNPAFTLGDP